MLASRGVVLTIALALHVLWNRHQCARFSVLIGMYIGNFVVKKCVI